MKTTPLLALLLVVPFLSSAHDFSHNTFRPDSLPPEVFYDFVQKTALFLDELTQSGYDPAWVPMRGFFLGTEQDFLNVIADNEDRNYSMGLALGFMGPKTSREYLVLPLVRRWLTAIPLICIKKERRPASIFREKVRSGWISTLEFKTAGFTPLDLKTTTPVRNDRPYASPVTFGATLSRLVNPDTARTRAWYVRSSFFLGIFGTGVGREFQIKAHKDHWFGSTRDVPQGWDNQIANGGGFSALYSLAMTTPVKKLTDEKTGRAWRVQTVATGEVMAGWYTNVAVGVGFKAGWFQSPFWIGNDIASPQISQGVSDSDTRPFGCWVYLRPRLRLVAHNTLLNGQLFDFLGKPSIHTFSWNQTNHAIFEFETGIGIKLRDWTISFEPITGRSPEFNTELKRWHFWGTVHFALNLDKTDPRRKALLDYRTRLDAILQSSGAGEEEEE